MKKITYILVFNLISCSSLLIGQNINSTTSLLKISDSIIHKYDNKNLFIRLNDSLLINGQEYSFPTNSINSINIIENINSENPDSIESIILDMRINQDIRQINPEFYQVVDSMPEFIGGNKELLQFISQNFEFKMEIVACCKIYIQFVVKETGELSDITIARGLEKFMDEELVRVFSIMPAWKPGKLNNKFVPVRIIIPVDFTLK